MSGRSPAPGQLGRGFGDLAAILLLVAIELFAVIVRPDVGGPFRVILGFVFVFFLPGYALTAALFPALPDPWTRGRDTPGSNANSGSWPRGMSQMPSAAEWLVLTVGLSIVTVPLTALVVNFLPLPIRRETTIGAVGVVIVVLTLAAIVRRAWVAPSRRVAIPYGRALQTIRTHLSGGPLGGPSAASVAVAGCLLAAGVAGATLVTPQDGEKYTEFYLQTRDPDTGQYVADDYPTQLGADNQVSLFVGLVNREGETISYTVIARLDRVAARNGEPRVTERRRLDRIETTVPHDGMWRQRHVVSPSVSGDHLRLTYLLYKGDPPQNPTVDTAYRSVHIWLRGT